MIELRDSLECSLKLRKVDSMNKKSYDMEAILKLQHSSQKIQIKRMEESCNHKNKRKKFIQPEDRQVLKRPSKY